MRRIDRYILSEMAVPALVGGFLVLLLLVGNQLYMLLRYLYQGVPAHDVLLTLLYYTPGVLMMAIPAALLLGTALGLNRLERDREILALR
ncbi:MAG TPA: LptF/LptG family permease, partial [Armatimonadota bacterium]